MNSTQIIFYVFGSVMVVLAVFLAVTKNIVHAAFAFLGILLGVAAIFIFSGAEFVAVAQVLIYIGGVLVLLVFGVMLTASYTGRKDRADVSITVITGLLCIAIFTIFIFVLLKIEVGQITAAQSSNPAVGPGSYTNSQKIGFLLMTDYVLPFEASGVLLMVALMGAAMIAGRKLTDK